MLSSTHHSMDMEGLASDVRNCHLNLQALQTEFATMLDRMSSGPHANSSFLHEVLCAARSQAHSLVRETMDAQYFMELIKLIEMLEADKQSLYKENQGLIAENRMLKEEVGHLRERLVKCEGNIIQIESEKQQLEFINQLNSQEKEINEERLGFSSKDGLELNSLENGSYHNPGRHLDSSPSVGSLRSSGRRLRLATGLRRDSEERSPLTKSCSGGAATCIKNVPGNFTMCMGDAIDGDELDELADKVNWYESIMRQLQEILGAEIDDPDVTYHAESTLIVARAKRAMEYREMVSHYEKTIDELQKKNNKLQKSRQDQQIFLLKGTKELCKPTTAKNSQLDPTIIRKSHHQQPLSTSTNTMKRGNESIS